MMSRYRAITPKTRLIRLSQPFLIYLRADGIRLPHEDNAEDDSWDDDSSEEDSAEDWKHSDPSLAWQDIHTKIKDTIVELNGSVFPKLNWSAPKDANWIAATNSMECRDANDIYLLLKSSDFVTHDLEQVFDDCEDDSGSEVDDSGDEILDVTEIASSEDESSKTLSSPQIPYHLILRKTIPNFNPVLEFRCFVRERQLLCMCQRDLNHYSFLPPLVQKLRPLIQRFFEKNLQRSFPDGNFAFDVYVPPPHNRVWLIDMNPWAPRTDPLLFSWLEILKMRTGSPRSVFDDATNNVVRIPLNGNGLIEYEENGMNTQHVESSEDSGEEFDSEVEDIFTPEFRLINRDDPEAYSFNTPQYSAHKLPKDVVDASNDGEAGLREFMGTWREIVAKQEREERQDNITAVDSIDH